MKATNRKRVSTQTMVLGAIMTALVVIAQLISMWIRTTTFSITLTHIPIVIGAALLGPVWGGWLGLVFGVVVLLSGDATPFLLLNYPGTIATVLAKGIAAGVLAGVVFRLFAKKNTTLAVTMAAIISPVANTGVFIGGCYLFLFDDIATAAAAAGKNMFLFILVTYVTVNFLIELISSLVLSPVAHRLILIAKKDRHDKSYT